MKKELTLERLKVLLTYKHDTGLFFWNSGRRGNARAGSVAGSSSQGYIHISIDGRSYSAHRLAWLWVYGAWPAGEVDHRDQDRSNNAIDNLRVTSRSENQQNSGWRTDNTSGYRGVCWFKRDECWKAQIKIKGKVHHLGYHTSAEAAHAAYKRAAAIIHTHNPYGST